MKATSLDDLHVGMRVSYVDDQHPERDGEFYVAFIDHPEAILKHVDGGWPRIAWQVSDFDLPHAHLFMKDDPE